MIVRLKTTIKIGPGMIEPAGSVYSDVDGSLPDFVTENMEFFEILEGTPTAKEVADTSAPAPKLVKRKKV